MSFRPSTVRHKDATATIFARALAAIDRFEPRDECRTGRRPTVGGWLLTIVVIDLATERRGAVALDIAAYASRLAERVLDPTVPRFYPTADPDTVLASTGTKSAVPIDVRDGTIGERWEYVPHIVAQLFSDYELPRFLVRVVSDELGGTPATIQLVDPATGEVVLESDPVDAHPIQIVSFSTWLRKGGELAVVPIGYNRAVVLDAVSGETWEIAAPVDDDRIWRFFPSYDGRFVTAYPEPPVGTAGADRGEAWIAPLEPGAEWVPLDSAEDEMSMLVPSTPAG